MERTRSTTMPDVKVDSSIPEPGIEHTTQQDPAAEQTTPATQDVPDQSPVKTQDESLMKSKAFTESVQEEITDDNDVLLNRHTTFSDVQVTENSREEGASEEIKETAVKSKGTAPGADRHQLLSAWSFWYVYSMSHRDKKKTKQLRRNDYDLREVYSFETIEDFWHMYNNLYSVSEIISNTDYLLFKKGIRPEWEDPENKNGGKWVITMPIEDDLEEDCEKAWLQLILHLISGQLPKEQRDVINGIVFSIRDKHMRLSIWISVSKEIQLLQDIGTKLRQITQLDHQYRFGFQEHQKAIKHDLDNQNFLEV